MKKRLEASYTIEAAFILPLTFALLYGILFLGFYLHDYTVIQQCAGEGAFYGAGQTEIPSEGEIYDYIEERLEKRLFVSEIKQIMIDTGKDAMEVRISGEAGVLNFSVSLLGYNQERGIQTKGSAEYPCAADYVRQGLVMSEKIRGLWKTDEEE